MILLFGCIKADFKKNWNILIDESYLRSVLSSSCNDIDLTKVVNT